MELAVSIIDVAPLSIAVMALALAIVLATDGRFRRTVAALACLSPLFPLFALRLIALGIVIGVDLLLQMRWAAPFVGPARRLADALEKR